MKKFFHVLFVVFSLYAAVALGEVKSLKTLVNKATEEEKKDLVKLLDQISLKPKKDPKTGKMVFEVTKIQKGSVFEREGLKLGDLVSQ